MDGAIDDFEGLLPLDQVEAAVLEGRCVSRWKEAEPRGKVNLATGEISEGRTWNFGSRQSDKYCRMYDKGKQTKSADPWVRVEVEMKDEQAEAFASLLVGGAQVGELVAAVLKAMVSFRQQGEDSHRDRWEVCDWWEAFLGAVAAVRLSVAPGEARTMTDRLEWIRRQVGPSLALAVRSTGDWEIIADIVADGDRRLRPSHLALLGRSPQAPQGHA
jgi:phage replication initiation protein